MYQRRNCKGAGAVRVRVISQQTCLAATWPTLACKRAQSIDTKSNGMSESRLGSGRGSARLGGNCTSSSSVEVLEETALLPTRSSLRVAVLVSLVFLRLLGAISRESGHQSPSPRLCPSWAINNAKVSETQGYWPDRQRDERAHACPECPQPAKPRALDPNHAAHTFRLVTRHVPKWYCV
jgi:hypothetical protein